MATHLISDALRDECEVERERKRRAGRIGSEEREETERKSISEETQGIRKELSGIGKIRQDVSELKQMNIDFRKLLECVEEVKVNLKIHEERLTKQDKRLDSMFKKIEAQSIDIASMREEMVKTKDRVVDTESVVTETRANLEKREDRVKKLEEKTIDQEARGRRNNLLFHGIPEKADEDCMKLSHEFIREQCKLGYPVQLERAHRIGRKKDDGKSRPVIAKFLDFTQRQAVSKARKGLKRGLGISEDLPFEVREGRRQLGPELVKARDENKKAWIIYPCRLFIDGEEVRTINPATIGGRKR